MRARQKAGGQEGEKNRMRGASTTIRTLTAGILLVFPVVGRAAPPAPSQQTAAPPKLSSQQERRLPRQSFPTTAAVQGVVRGAAALGIVGATATLTSEATGAARKISANGDGVFRFLDLPPGAYSLRIEGEGYENLIRADLLLNAGDVVMLELTLTPTSAPPAFAMRLPRMPERGPPSPPTPPITTAASYRAMRRRPDAEPGAPAEALEMLPPVEQVYVAMPDRWNVAIPDWNRYGRSGEYPYVRKSHWWDPFNRNRLKGDEPIFGQQTFVNITATAETKADGRRLPVPSDVSTARPGSAEFFGKGEQIAPEQTFRFSLDLFHGDTAFRPVDWRIRVTPAVDVNYLLARELGVVKIDVRGGTTRLDSHAGLQEAFVEYKIRDLSPNYDFISLRAGIQEFSSDFRGFLFVDEAPGVRLFGNLHSDRWEYNAAYFNLLEKDTNSGLNTFEPRHQQVLIANLYVQDFIKPGYTTEFSVHYNEDDASTHYDDNGFLVRPAPIGAVRMHNVHVAYLGWAGNGHFGRINVNHAFYEALGRDDLNPIAGRRVTINAQMAAAEVSLDRDWARYKVSAFFASGDGNPRGPRATGFDSIVDEPAFAGGIFSLWNREGIRLTGTGVALTSPNSLLPGLRPNKEEGQANFVNPGIFILNAAADFDLTPKLKGVVNVNYLRFERTAPVELLLFISPIHNTIGVDSDLGFEYRPPLSENIVIKGGVSALSPGQGFRDIYSGRTLFSLFANMRFQF